MPDDLVIRRERPDQPEVVALLDALDAYLGELYEPQANHILDVQALLAPDIAFHVARRGARVVATGALRRQAGEGGTGGAPFGEIKRMVVEPAERGRGVGERMLRSLEDVARAQGLRWTMLETGRKQVRAVQLYERCGYVPCAAFGGYPDNGLSVFYAKAL
jgi:putative acetyltransferase